MSWSHLVHDSSYTSNVFVRQIMLDVFIILQTSHTSIPPIDFFWGNKMCTWSLNVEVRAVNPHEVKNPSITFDYSQLFTSADSTTLDRKHYFQFMVRNPVLGMWKYCFQSMLGWLWIRLASVHMKPVDMKGQMYWEKQTRTCAAQTRVVQESTVLSKWIQTTYC